jgi:PAS domain-containing protein
MTHSPNRIGCAEFRQQLRASRRSFLKAGGLGVAGLTLSDLLRHEARAGAAAKKENSVLILWMRGGPSQHETWDPKPNAPIEYRGAFGATQTNVPGIEIVDLLPRCAKIMDKWSIIRSLHHTNAGHSAGDQILFTGHQPGPDPNVNIHPSCGSIVSEQLGHLTPELPSYVMIPRQVPGTDSAYLGAAHKPFETIVDPANDGPFTLQNFSMVEGISDKRFGDRKTLLNGFDRFRASLDGQMEGVNEFNQQAYGILSSNRARAAFDLDAERDPVRERYGFIPRYDPMDPRRCSANAFCQRVLLGRRLVEAGVRLVTVDCRWWDTHVQGVDSMRNGFLPRWDLCYSALIEDLEQRSLLETTLVVAWGEFGRTPRVNKDNGRDHYPNVFSAALAGGPVKGGRVVGSSDAKGAFPKDDPTDPQDVLATIYKHLGIDTEKSYLDHSGRPIVTLPFGKAVDALT